MYFDVNHRIDQVAASSCGCMGLKSQNIPPKQGISDVVRFLLNWFPKQTFKKEK